MSLDSGLLVFKTSYAGDLSIKWEEVVNLKTDEPIKLVLGDETTAQGPVSPGDSGKVQVKAEQGAGAGYQFFESERTNLALEGGLSYVNEDYSTAPDDSYAAGRWGLRFDYYILPKSIQFFLYHTGLQSLSSSDDLNLYTQTRFRIPFYKDLNVTLQMNWAYDESPAPGKEKNDYTYILSLGYLWAN